MVRFLWNYRIASYILIDVGHDFRILSDDRDHKDDGA